MPPDLISRMISRYSLAWPVSSAVCCGLRADSCLGLRAASCSTDSAATCAEVRRWHTDGLVIVSTDGSLCARPRCRVVGGERTPRAGRAVLKTKELKKRLWGYARRAMISSVLEAACLPCDRAALFSARLGCAEAVDQLSCREQQEIGRSCVRVEGC